MKTANRVRQRQQTHRRKTVGLPDELIGPNLEPFEEIALKHQIEQIDQQLHSLAEKYRIPIVLFYYLNRTTSQIANELSLTVTTVEGRLKRGRQQLKRGMLRNGTQLSIPISTLASVEPSIEVVQKTTSLLSIASDSQTETAHGPSNRQIFMTIPGGLSMFTKLTLTAAAALLFTIGSIMHATPVDQRDSNLVVKVTDNSEIENQPIDVAATTAAPAEEASYWSHLTEIPVHFRSVEFEDASLHDRIHDHLFELHNQLYDWLTSSTPVPKQAANSVWIDLGIDEIQTDENGEAFIVARTVWSSQPVFSSIGNE